MNLVPVEHDGVKVLVKKPSKRDKDDAQLVYASAWRKAVEGKAVLREKLNEHLAEQGLWDEARQKKYEDILNGINDKEMILKKGGIPLREAKKVAFELRSLRIELRDLIAVRTAYDGNTAEGLADNARFDHLVTVCVLDPNTQKPIFKDLEEYNEKGTEEWAIKAASQLASFLYELDPKYEENLEENKFLKNHKFVDEKGRLINKEGHLIAIGADKKERLIDENGDYVAYESDGTKYKVYYDGTRVEEIVQAPFLDDDNNAVTTEDELGEESEEETPVEAE